MSHWFRWWPVTCSAPSLYPNQLKDRWFETSWRPCQLRHCNNNATKCDFGITNDYNSNERVWRFALLLTGDAIEQTVDRLVIGNIKTLMWRHCNSNAISVLQMTMSAVRECGCFLCYKQGHTAEQQSSGWVFETSWRSGCVAVITML